MLQPPCAGCPVACVMLLCTCPGREHNSRPVPRCFSHVDCAMPMRSEREDGSPLLLFLLQASCFTSLLALHRAA